MKKFVTHTGLVAPIDRSNIDTDLIIPKQFLKSIRRSGFGVNAFDSIRYLDPWEYGKPDSERRLNPEFSLNFPRYQGASILLTRENFGCGSSREHAPWALDEYGFRSIIAPSFADIFYNNCFKNGMLPVVLDADIVDLLFKQVEAEEGYELTINLDEQKVVSSSGESYDFDVDEFRKYCLLNGFDDIGLTLKDADKIREYEANRRQQSPWLFNTI
jgi:3-isopropylmalate/(R)-2-methylmalate dehydratase small subunit